MILCYMKERRIHQCSSYQETLECSHTPVVISIRERQEDLSQLIHFLKKYIPPRPFTEIVLANDPIRVTDMQFLINHFNIFRIVPYDTSDSDLKEISFQAFQRHQVRISGAKSLERQQSTSTEEDHLERQQSTSTEEDHLERQQSTSTEEDHLERQQSTSTEEDHLERQQSTPTEEDHLERQILESAKMAELGTIGSGIAHELSNPLGGMISFIKLIKMDCPKEGPHYAEILKMEKVGQKCKKIIENLLNFSKPHYSSESTLVDLRDVIKQSIQIIELQKRAKDLKWVLEFPDKLIKVKGQANLLTQAIYNILQNSIDAIGTREELDPMYDGLIKVELRSSEEDELTLLITDDGIGIPDPIQAKVLAPLFSTKKSHTGLGLTVAHQIITEHGGNLDIHSHPGTGTTVKISLNV